VVIKDLVAPPVADGSYAPILVADGPEGEGASVGGARGPKHPLKISHRRQHLEPREVAVELGAIRGSPTRRFITAHANQLLHGTAKICGVGALARSWLARHVAADGRQGR